MEKQIFTKEVQAVIDKNYEMLEDEQKAKVDAQMENLKLQVSEYEKENPVVVLPSVEELREAQKKKLSHKKNMTPEDEEKLIHDKELELIEKKTQISNEEYEKIQAAFKDKSFEIDVDEVRKYLGKPVFDESQIKTASVPGTAIGLAWTSMGGDTLLLESIHYESSKGGLQLTGQLGDVMKESAQIAMTWAKQYAISNKIKDSEWFEKNTIHLHIPEGATPKDGPSAGITMATTFVSLLRNKKIKQNLAMTGELSLTGQVLPIGGLREKTVAAKRNKIKTIIIPKANVRDLDEIPEHVKEGINFVPVTNVKEVIDYVF